MPFSSPLCTFHQASSLNINQLRDGSGEGSEVPIKRRHLASTIFKEMNSGRIMQDSVHFFEPMIRKWVQEAVECAINPYMRSSYAKIEGPGSRTLQLQFHSTLAPTLFTGNKITSTDRSLIKIVLYDSTAKKVVNSGPLSSAKVSIVVLDGDFETDDKEDWTKKEFEKKIVKNREGKRPLVTGELMVPLQDGVGYVGNIIFTDNSSWIRSGKFRLGAKVTNSDETGIREARSNAFRVKDHRGESYQKHKAPALDDEVWRLEKIAKDGASHKKLSDNEINTVGDFLRLYVTNQSRLHEIIQPISNKSWETIIAHAMKCKLDDKRFLYRTGQGTCLLFNSICNVVEVAFDGETYQSVNSLNAFHKAMVEDLKQLAYRNVQDWVQVSEPFIVPTANIADSNFLLPGVHYQEQDQQGMELNTDHRTRSLPYKQTEEQDNPGFSLGGSSHTTQGFNLNFRNSFGLNDTCGELFIGGPHSWAPEGSYLGPQLLTDDLPIDDTFQVKPLWQGNELFIDPINHDIGAFCSNTDILTPRGTPKMNWCKVLAVVKWRILVRRNVAARKCYNYI